MDEHRPEAVAELLERAREALSQRPTDGELRQAYDQLVADRTNGESPAPAYERLAAAVDHDT